MTLQKLECLKRNIMYNINIFNTVFGVYEFKNKEKGISFMVNICSGCWKQYI